MIGVYIFFKEADLQFGCQFREFLNRQIILHLGGGNDNLGYGLLADTPSGICWVIQ